MPNEPVTPPTEKQIKFAKFISGQLREPLPPDVLINIAACSDYIRTFGPEAQRRKASAPEAVSIPTAISPSAQQEKFVRSIVKKLGSEVDEKEVELALANVADCSAFISKHKPAFDARVMLDNQQKERRLVGEFWDAFNSLDVASPDMRRAILAAEDTAAKTAVVRDLAAGGVSGFARLDAAMLNSTQEKLIGYWLEGLQSTAFDSLGELPNLIGEKGSTFDFENISTLLAETAVAHLKFDQAFPPVRHLVLKLVDCSRKPKKQKPIVLSVLPLMAVQDPALALGYRWVSAPEKIPLFNRDLIGESARKPGLALERRDQFDAWALERGDESPALDPGDMTLNDALGIWDDAFNILAQPGYGGVAGYISRFNRSKAEFWQIKWYKVAFSFVDGSAATGTSRQVSNAYRQILAEPELLNDSRLDLFRRAADVSAPDAHRYDTELQGRRLDHLSRYAGHMDSWRDGQREAFSLDPAQRDALIALEMTGHGRLLAVNGPPGTGKTSLLRGVIASIWVAPLLSDSANPQCPLVLACAATNQAVTNVIGSFDETPGAPLFDETGAIVSAQAVTADSRWLPHLASYGWYVPSSVDENAQRDYAKYQMLGRKSPARAWDCHGVAAPFGSVDDTQAEADYLYCAERYLGTQCDLATAAGALRERVRHSGQAIAVLQRRLGRWTAHLDMLMQSDLWGTGHQQRRDRLIAQSEPLVGKDGQRSQLLAAIAALESKLDVLARFNDFSEPTPKFQSILNLVSAADRLHADTDFVAIKRQHDELTLFAKELDKGRRNSFLQRIKRAFSAVFPTEETKLRLGELQLLLKRFDIPYSEGAPDFDAYHLGATQRLAGLASSLDQAAADGLRFYLARQGATLTPTSDYRAIWPAELNVLRDQLRAQRAQLLVQVGHLDDLLGTVGAQLASLKGVFDAHTATCAKVRAVSDGIAAALQAFDHAEAGTDLILKCMDQAYGVTVSGAQTGDGLGRHLSDLNRIVQDWLDTKVRTRMFHLAARYWEGRYLLARKDLARQQRADDTYVVPSEMQLRMLAMLAPVFVVTAYSAPKLMRRNMRGLDEDQPPYLFGEADLLIVDEAGQGTPDIGASAFLFAQRAIVVGDTAQLEPVWSMGDASDKALVQRFGLGPAAALAPSGVLLSRGSVMRMAQRASSWANPAFPDAPGLTLTNHYRCLTPIIDICNRMVYGGALRVATRPPKTLWRPELARLGFLVVDAVDNTRKASGSRHNASEAQCIARWVHENEASIVKHYSSKKPVAIEDVLAIITPFSGQKDVLKKALARQYRLEYDETDKSAIYNRLTINTVHTLQGAEKQIVIFAMVETNEPAIPQFYDKGTNLINVAISRAKEMFIVALTQKAVDYARQLDPDQLGKPSNFLWQAAVCHGTRLNARRLVIVESPNKCDTVGQALGGSIELEVLATEGHIAELDEPANRNALTADVPSWRPISAAGEKLFGRIAALWPDLDSCCLATDPDAEGEAIAWHVLRVLHSRTASGSIARATGKAPDVRRMRFFSLDPAAIRGAYDCAGAGLDAGMVKSALTRALLDYAIATSYGQRLGLGPPLQFARGIGRVQIGVLDLVHQACAQHAVHGVAVTVPLANGDSMISHLFDPRKGEVWTSNPAQAEQAASKLRARLQHAHQVSATWTGERLRQLPPYPGLNTARLLALAWRARKMSPQAAMAALQLLYEGYSQETPHDALPRAVAMSTDKAGTLTSAPASAHPMLEPLDYDLTPEIAATVMHGDSLDIYTLLWNAALATAMDGPALRTEHLSIRLTCDAIVANDVGLQLRATHVACPDGGWGELLPVEYGRAQVQADEFASPFPQSIHAALALSGKGHLDGAGRRQRSALECAPAVMLLGDTRHWQVGAVALRDPAPTMDRLIERMAQDGVGRPSTYADRLGAALEHDLIIDDGGQLHVGRYGQTVMESLERLPVPARIGAAFSSDLETALGRIETDATAAGAVLRAFTERALDEPSMLADWLDDLLIEGESMTAAAARVELMLPSAIGWAAVSLPAGLNPESLVQDAARAGQLRAELDALLAAPDRPAWKRTTPRHRAAARLAALEGHACFQGAQALLVRSARDIALRWWIDLAPGDAKLTDTDMMQVRHAGPAPDAQTVQQIAVLADALAVAL